MGGPLKALVKEMSKENAPSMPGLLYEAGLPDNAVRPGRPSADAEDHNNNENENRRRTSQNSGAESASSGESETVVERPSGVAPISGAKKDGRSQLNVGRFKPKG